MSAGGAGRPPYGIVYSARAEEHLKALAAAQRAAVLEQIGRQLAYEPAAPARNRKMMRTNPVATRELRIGGLRVYYDVEEEPRRRVEIVAIGIKLGSRVRIGGEEMTL